MVNIVFESGDNFGVVFGVCKNVKGVRGKVMRLFCFDGC